MTDLKSKNILFRSLLLNFIFIFSLQANCYVSVQDLIFSPYDAAAQAPQTTNAEYMLECRQATIVTLEISSEGNMPNTRNRRLLHSHGKDKLAYNLFSDNAMTQVWGDGRLSPALVKRVENRSSGLIHAKIFPGQDVWPGEYSDSIRIKVLY